LLLINPTFCEKFGNFQWLMVIRQISDN
jgi:hypothetical protein